MEKTRTNRNTGNIITQRAADGGAKVRLRRGYGTIRYISTGRSRPYAVHPPAERVVKDGQIRYQRPKALCYVSDWYTGFAVLTAWHAGLYNPGMELEIDHQCGQAKVLAEMDHMVQQIKKQGQYMSAPARTSRQEMSAGIVAEKNSADHSSDSRPHDLTVKDIYEKYYDYKYGSEAARKLSASTAKNTRAISKKLMPIYTRTLDSLTVDELQQLVNSISLGRTMVSKTLLLIKELYGYALSREYCTRNPAQYLRMPDTRDYVHHQDFRDEELAILWAHREDPVVRMILLMCYSGFRISAYESLEIHLEEGYFRGGVKTKAGRNRVVPIHSAIQEIVEELLASRQPYLVTHSKACFSRRMRRKLIELGIDVGDRHHTPHSCRHTFSRLCESYGVREADRKRLLGHSFGNDITNGVYGHRSIAELRTEIEKIQVPVKE